MILKHTVYRPI